MGVPQAGGVDIDTDALKVAAENARLNRLTDRLELVMVADRCCKWLWAVVFANVLPPL